jgi:hypothetical protein
MTNPISRRYPPVHSLSSSGYFRDGKLRVPPPRKRSVRLRKNRDDAGVERRHNHAAFDNSTDAVQENGTYEGQGKAAGSHDWRLCCFEELVGLWILT